LLNELNYSISYYIHLGILITAGIKNYKTKHMCESLKERKKNLKAKKKKRKGTFLLTFNYLGGGLG
jgi:hypothetical protein